jgi:hypothetical protein
VSLWFECPIAEIEDTSQNVLSAAPRRLNWRAVEDPTPDFDAARFVRDDFGPER